jgi:hypothetical protein
LSSIAFADVDGDGDPDVLITGSSIISFFPSTQPPIAQLCTNDGTGGYTLVFGTPFQGVGAGSIAFADVDGDGDQDVLIMGWNFSEVPDTKLYTNDGIGGYTLVSGTPFEALASGSIAFADVDGDGDPDVLITGINWANQEIAQLYANDGTGGYTLVSGTPFEGVYSGSIAFADVDGDGDPDVLITGWGWPGGGLQPIAKLYTNDGTGGYTLVSGTPFEGVYAGSIAFADVDGDEDPDVLITGGNDSNWPITKLYANDGTGGYTLVSGTPFEGVWQSSIAFADVDGDGDPDVLITGQNNSDQLIAQLYANDGTGGYTLVSGTPFDGVLSSSIAFADVDGDGDPDVLITGVVSSVQSIAQLYANDGTGGYTLVSGTPFDGVSSTSIAFADVDGDGDPDVLITGFNSSGPITQLYRNVSTNPCPINASCSPYTLILSSSGTATLSPDDVNNGSTVSCGTPILSLSQTEFDLTHTGENTVNLVVTDEFGNSDACTAVVTVVEGPLAIIEFDINGLSLGVWPNPASEVIFATFSAVNGSEASVELFDIKGEVLATPFRGYIVPGVEQRIEMNVGNLANGFYMCRFITEHGTLVKKLVVSR